MSRLNVNPTRMELTRLKRLLSTSVRGHKLLKDKQDEMVRQYMLLIKENRSLRLSVEEKLESIITTYKKASMKSSDSLIEEALMIASNSLDLNISSKNIMNIPVPNIQILEESKKINLTYGLAFTPSELDTAVLDLSSILQDLVKLASLEKTCDMLAVEIEKTRRRVNAIEFVMIPSYQETIHFIAMKLDDNERSNTIRLMKSKEIIMNK